jgi:tetratricopeptide (TPR) repeat protein
MINAVFGARYHVADALLIYHDFRQDPATAGIDAERAIESVGYHCLKNGAIPTGLALLTENLQNYPTSALAHFGYGRALRASGRESEARREFSESLRLDPSLTDASQALASRVLPY